MHKSTVDEIMDEARSCRMFLLVDDASAASGDLVIPAQMATPLRSTSWQPTREGLYAGH